MKASAQLQDVDTEQGSSRSSSSSPSPSPRRRKSLASQQRRQEMSFTHETKDLCWKRAELVPGRHEDRWRVDAAGNIVCRRLRNCNGPLCMEYDHITPISKGGNFQPGNCQILQSRTNRNKGDKIVNMNNMFRAPEPINGSNNKTPPPLILADLVPMADLYWHAFGDRDLDAVELAVYGDIKRENGIVLRYIPKIGRAQIDDELDRLKQIQINLLTYVRRGASRRLGTRRKDQQGGFKCPIM